MSNIVSSIARFLTNDIDALDVLSQNVANMRTNGYRAERLKPDFSSGILDSVPTLDMADGSLSTTGHPLDLAIRGNGFFVVDVNGQSMLTRNGQFHIDADKQLVDAGGHPVMGQSGPITLEHATVHISPSGEISDGTDSVDSLRIVTVDQPKSLRDMGDGLYSYTGSGDDANFIGRIQQGALEQSNVDPGAEMVRLMALSRHAQSVQRAIQAYDATLQAGISQLGNNT
jgi:flagellar basal-body rod protein FlgF